MRQRYKYPNGSNNINYKHGMSRTPIHAVWKSMRARCYNENDKGYKNYGGRGITVCERWHTFAEFYKDMGGTYAPGLMLERVDNDGNYEPDNCVWADRVTQNRNSRKVVLNIEIAARIRSMRAEGRIIRDIANELNLPMGTISNVLYNHSWKE